MAGDLARQEILWYLPVCTVLLRRGKERVAKGSLSLTPARLQKEKTCKAWEWNLAPSGSGRRFSAVERRRGLKCTAEAPHSEE